MAQLSFLEFHLKQANRQTDEVCMYKEMMTNDDNVESSLLTSSLLKMRSLYKFCVQLQVVCVKLEI